MAHLTHLTSVFAFAVFSPAMQCMECLHHLWQMERAVFLDIVIGLRFKHSPSLCFECSTLSVDICCCEGQKQQTCFISVFSCVYPIKGTVFTYLCLLYSNPNPNRNFKKNFQIFCHRQVQCRLQDICKVAYTDE